MPFSELPPFFAGLRGHDGSAVRALEFLLQPPRTPPRSSDFAAREWVVPASRMKSGKAHRAPLGRLHCGFCKRRSRCAHPAITYFPARVPDTHCGTTRCCGSWPATSVALD